MRKDKCEAQSIAPADSTVEVRERRGGIDESRDGKVYFTSEEGDVYVLQAEPEYKLLATNKMGEICMATPAISEGNLFFRTQGHIVAIGR